MQVNVTRNGKSKHLLRVYRTVRNCGNRNAELVFVNAPQTVRLENACCRMENADTLEKPVAARTGCQSGIHETP